MKLVTPRILLAALATAGLVGCANPGPPLPPSLELPRPVSDLRATRKGDKVYLFWTVATQTVDRQNVVHRAETRICRAAGKEITDCGTGVGEVSASQFPVTLPEKKKPREKPPKVEASFIDTLPSSLLQQDANAVITYGVEAYNTHHRTAGLSNQVHVPAVAAVAPPANFSAQVTVDGVILSWSPVAKPPEIEGLNYVIRVYRRPEDEKTDAIAGETLIDATTLTDHGFEWEKTYDYRATVVTEIAQPGKGELPMEGDDTAAVRVFAHDVFPPAVPSGLQAVAAGVGQQPGIDLVWAPDTETDLAGYTIYRREEGGQPEKISKELVKASSYRDTSALSGHAYFYSISAVDLRGNESARSEEAHESMP
jgi:hypothetical protein